MRPLMPSGRAFTEIRPRIARHVVLAEVRDFRDVDPLVTVARS
jgi:hypothetical protein